MGCCLSQDTQYVFATASVMNEAANKMGMNGKYGNAECKARGEFPNPSYEHVKETLELMVGPREDGKPAYFDVNKKWAAEKFPQARRDACAGS